MKEFIYKTMKLEYGILSFQMNKYKNMNKSEKILTKQDLFDYLDANDLKNTDQLVGGIFFIKKINILSIL